MLRNEKLVRFQETLAEQARLMPRSEALIKGLCVKCRQPAFEKCSTEAGRREYQINGTCEECFDSLFSDIEAEPMSMDEATEITNDIIDRADALKAEHDDNL